MEAADANAVPGFFQASYLAVREHRFGTTFRVLRRAWPRVDSYAMKLLAPTMFKSRLSLDGALKSATTEAFRQRWSFEAQLRVCTRLSLSSERKL